MAVSSSVLDRLIDLQPESTKEVPPGYWEAMRDLRASICRDLSDLLNTRRAEEDFDAEVYNEAANSLLRFGIIDFTSFNLKSGVEQEEVRRSIERAIRQFEPRLGRVTVTLEEPDPANPVLRFQITALLRTEDGSEPVTFDATLSRESRRFAVSGANA